MLFSCPLYALMKLFTINGAHGFWLDKCTRESRHTRELRHSAVKQVCPESVKQAISTADFVAKSRTAAYFLLQICATCNKPNWYKTGLKVTSKKCNIAIQLVWQQFCKTSCKFLLPPLMYLHAMVLFFFKGQSSAHAWAENNHNNSNVRKTHDKFREA